MSEKLHRRLWLVSLMAMCLPFLLLTKLPGAHSVYPATAKGISLYLSAILGYIGTVFLLIEMAIGTRAVLRYFLKDVPKAIKLHSLLGKYGTLLIFLHPILITYSYGEKWFYSFLPRLAPEFEQHITYGRIAFILLLLIWFTSALVRGRLAYRPWKYIHYLSYPILPFVLIHSPFVGTTLRSSRPLLAYWYVLCGLFLILFGLRLVQYFNYKKRLYQIVRQWQVAPNVFAMQLKADGPTIELLPGQYIHLQKSLFGEEHPFSVLDFRQDSGEIIIAYKVFGRFTKQLADMPAGDMIWLDGPFGAFTSEIDNRQAVFIAGGIGITPFYRRIMQAPSDALPMLINCNQSLATVAFRDQLKQKLGNSYVDILSDQKLNAPQVEYGRLSPEHLQKYLPEPKANIYFLCGPQGMMAAARKYLVDLGVADQDIHSEDFSL